MAELDFENDLRAMFDRAEPAPDAAAFALEVDRRINRRFWQRFALVTVLGAAGVLIAWLQLGLSLSDFHIPLPQLQSIGGPDGVGLWAAGLLLLAAVWFGLQSVFSET